MADVFIRHHVRYDDEYGEDAKLIGVYKTEHDAKAATFRLSPGPQVTCTAGGLVATC